MAMVRAVEKAGGEQGLVMRGECERVDGEVIVSPWCRWMFVGARYEDFTGDRCLLRGCEGR